MTRQGEALVAGQASYSDRGDAVRDALRARFAAAGTPAWVCIVDMTDTDVVYAGGDFDDDDLYQCSYSIGDGGAVTLGEPEHVVRTYIPAPPGEAPDDAPADQMAESATESAPTRAQLAGRVLEAKGTADDGGRIFGVRLIAYGDSKNGRRYPENVMRAAAPLYEGAKVFDHHRSAEHMSSGSTSGLVGQIRGVHATAEGLEGELRLLPSATRVAEALDASLAAEADGLPPLVGLSHDVMAQFRPVADGDRRLMEATQIVSVNSTDVVADPAAGGRATRAVAGGTTPAGDGPDETEEQDVPPTRAEILAAFTEATDDELAAAGLARASTTTTGSQGGDGGQATETTTPAGTRVFDTSQPKGSFLGRLMVREAVTAAGLPDTVVETVTAALPERITESDVDAQVAALKTAMGLVERAGLAPTVTAQVTQESLDKKRAALDAMFAGDYSKGYRSFKEAFVDFTGRRPRSFDEDFNRTILRESLGHFDSQLRSTESVDSTSWSHVLGDSITRRMVADYQQPNLQTWRAAVSSIVPVADFRTQRIQRIGGYGTLPAVNQGAPYQPLTSPTDEEVTYAISKRGGTEDVTLEMIANDDIRAIQRIPGKLGLAAAQTLYRFVWDILNTNPNIYDGVALFGGTGHNNSATSALSQSALTAGRTAMRSQSAFGDSSDVLSFIPRTLVVVNELEELGFQLSTSAVAVPSTPAGPSDTPNIHRGLDLVVVDYWSSTTKWQLIADPAMCPLIELGFYQGRQDPELFTQADPNVGSVFDADKVTYKIRHIYSGAVQDFRGFYQGNS